MFDQNYNAPCSEVSAIAEHLVNSRIPLTKVSDNGLPSYLPTANTVAMKTQNSA